MSDQINFLIHTNAANAFRQGRITEQNRIIRLLEQTPTLKEKQKKLLIETIAEADLSNRYSSDGEKGIADE